MFNGKAKVGVNVIGTNSIYTKSSAPSAELIGSTVLEGIDGQNFVLDMYVEDNDILPFGDSPSTKGSIVTSSIINGTGQAFALNGWLRSTNRYPNDGSAGRVNVEEDKTNYHFVNTTVTKGAEDWTVGQEAYWRNAVPTTFWSYYPIEDSARVLSLPGQTPTDAQQDAFTFTYTTPESVADQKDLLFAYNQHTVTYDDKGETEDSESVDIDFYHALSAIRFDVSGIENATISNVSFTGIAVAGTCNVSGGATAAGVTTPGKVTFAWTPGTTGTRSQALVPEDFTETGLDGETDNALMPLSSSKFFFFIPQEIKDKGVKIGITYTNSGKSVTKTVDLNHDVAWEAGKIYTYKLSVYGNVADAEVTATIETTYSDMNVTGSDAKLTLTKTSGTVSQWTLKNVKFSQNGVDFRSTASVDVTSGTAVTITPVSGKPYMPKTDTGGATYSWTADIYYTVADGEHFLKTVTGTVNAPGPAADKFEIKMNFDGYTNFSVAKGYDGQTKNVTKANNTDVSKGGMDKETVYNVGGKEYVSGLSVDVKTQCESLLKCENENTMYDDTTVVGTGVNFIKQLWAAHTISCYAEFDGVAPNTQPSKKVHITGLPYSIIHPANNEKATKGHPWTRYAGDISWDDDKIDLGYDTKTREPIVQSPYFHIPEDLDVRLSGNITSTGSTNTYDLEIKPNGVSDKYVHTKFNKNNPWQGPLDATMEKGQFRWEIQHHNIAIYALHCYVYSFNIDYK